MKVSIIISAYNGREFLNEQLQSVAGLKGCEFEVLVRDDGSTDSTPSILDSWQRKGLLKWYGGKNIGYALSFIELVSKAPDSDYYAFCDQDDIWLPDKLERAVSMLEKEDNDIKLYCSNVYYYKDGIVNSPIHSMAPYFDKYTCMLRNIAPGCSMVFSRKLRDIIAGRPPQQLIAHDFFVFQLAVLTGKVIYDICPSMKYRQHGNNQIGQKTGIKEIWKRRIKNLMNSSIKNQREMQAAEMLRCYGELLPEDSYKICSTVAGYRKSFRKKLELLFDRRYTVGSLSGNMWLKFRIILNRL